MHEIKKNEEWKIENENEMNVKIKKTPSSNLRIIDNNKSYKVISISYYSILR